jgi:hypothetical protein
MGWRASKSECNLLSPKTNSWHVFCVNTNSGTALLRIRSGRFEIRSTWYALIEAENEEMVTNVPKDIIDAVNTAGMNKARMSLEKTLVMGFLAGAFIAFGGFLAISVPGVLTGRIKWFAWMRNMFLSYKGSFEVLTDLKTT